MISLHCQHQRSTSLQRDRPALNCISEWRFYVGKNWIINLDYLWQHINPNVKPSYRSPLLIFTERENSTFSSSLFVCFCYCRYRTRNLYTEMKKEKDKAMLWFNSKKMHLPPVSFLSTYCTVMRRNAWWAFFTVWPLNQLQPCSRVRSQRANSKPAWLLKYDFPGL